VRLQDKVFELVAKGGRNDIKILKLELENDPKKFIYDKTDHHHLINKCNRMKQNPLYVACKHGNLKMVKFLLSE
jgi:ankyrin repeat protein